VSLRLWHGHTRPPHSLAPWLSSSEWGSLIFRTRFTEQEKKMQKIKKPKFNHDIALNFTVTSEHEDWFDCLCNEKEKLINALMERINVLLSEDSQYYRSFEHIDTVEEN
jgi:hypothetical protein